MQKSSVFGLALCLSVAATTCMAASDNAPNVGPRESHRHPDRQLAGGEPGNGDRLDRDLQLSEPVIPCHCWTDWIDPTRCNEP